MKDQRIGQASHGSDEPGATFACRETPLVVGIGGAHVVEALLYTAHPFRRTDTRQRAATPWQTAARTTYLVSSTL
jgi:hypothetical protein